MDKNRFFAEYRLSEDDLTEANISWEELLLIEEAYREIETHLRDIGKSFIDEYLYDIETAGIHSYRYRTKGVMQLLEKVIRKKKENPEKFAELDHTVGLWSDYSATYNLGRYLTDYLNYPLVWDTETDFAQYEEVQSMPAFPSVDGIRMIDGTVVVKLS